MIIINFLTKRCWNIVEKHRITAASETAAKVMWGHWPDKTPISACARAHTHTHTHSLARIIPPQNPQTHIIDLTHLHLTSVMRIIHVNDSFKPKRCNTLKNKGLLLAFMVQWTTFIIHGTSPLHKIFFICSFAWYLYIWECTSWFQRHNQHSLDPNWIYFEIKTHNNFHIFHVFCITFYNL